MDWWGDTAGAYVRAENPAMRDTPDVFFEDCTLVGAQCSLKSGNPGFETYSRISLKRCRLFTLNFSQPHGTPTDGVIQSVMAGKYLHVDMEDTTISGYKVFGVRDRKDTVGDIGYTAWHSVRAYVQFQQEVPEGIQRLGAWPVEQMANLLPEVRRAHRPPMKELGLVQHHMCELTPVEWEGRLLHMHCVRPGSRGGPKDYFLMLQDAETGEELARFAEGHGLGSCIVHDGTFYAFASRWVENSWNDVTVFWSKDLKNWQKKVVIEELPDEQLFNSSVCRGPDGFVMAYESNHPAWRAFTSKFAVSDDLQNWRIVDDAVFGTDRYAACPCIRFVGRLVLQALPRTQNPAVAARDVRRPVPRSAHLGTEPVEPGNVSPRPG